MAVPTRTQILSLDVVNRGGPFVGPVVAKSTLTGEYTYRGLPITIYGEVGGGGGTPPPPFTAVPIYMFSADSAPPNTLTTIGRETGDPLLMDDGSTMEEEDGTLPTNAATMELFVSSTPTTGSWVVDRLWGTNDPSFGVLRSPLPTVLEDTQDAFLTVVATAPLTRISFSWGVLGWSSFDPNYSDTLRFFLNDVELLTERDGEWAGTGWLYEKKGQFSVVVQPGTHALRWNWYRAGNIPAEDSKAHAWITDLLIDPNF